MQVSEERNVAMGNKNCEGAVKHRSFVFVAALAIGSAVFNSGCLVFGALASITERDIQHMKEITDNLIPTIQTGEVYELTTDLFLTETGNESEMVFTLEVPVELQISGQKRTVPESVEAYMAQTENWQQIAGLVPKGARIKIVLLNENESLGLGYCYGTLLGERLHDSDAVLMDFVLLDSRRQGGASQRIVVDSRFLQRIDQPN